MLEGLIQRLPKPAAASEAGSKSEVLDSKVTTQ